MLRDLFSLFPAYAGVIPDVLEEMVASVTFPRIRGGDPLSPSSSPPLVAFSPHTRG